MWVYKSTRHCEYENESVYSIQITELLLWKDQQEVPSHLNVTGLSWWLVVSGLSSHGYWLELNEFAATQNSKRYRPTPACNGRISPHALASSVFSLYHLTAMQH